MFRKKKLIASLALIASMSCISACGNNNTDDKDSHNIKTYEGDSYDTEAYVGNNLVEYTENSEARADGDIKLLCQNDNHSNMVATNDGMYRIASAELPYGTYVNKIYYIDFKSAQEIVLCNAASCKHDTRNCMGIIDDEDMLDASLFVYDNKLYAFCSNDRSGSQSMQIMDDGYNSEEPSAILYEMNLDGTNRRKIDAFSDDVSIDSFVLGWNGRIIFAEKRINEKKNENGMTEYIGVDRRLISLNPKSGETDVLLDFPEEYGIAGVYKDKLLCYSQIYPNGYTSEDINGLGFDDWKNLTQQSKIEYFLLDMKTKESKSICTMDCSRYFDLGIVLKDKIYFFDETSNVLAVDIETGQSQNITVANNIPIVLVNTIGDRIYSWVKNKSEETYFFDPVKNDIVRVDMKIKNTNLSWDICASNNELAVVICDGDFEECGDGSYNELSYKYGIVKLSDLFSGNTSYIPVNMCSDGMNY